MASPGLPSEDTRELEEDQSIWHPAQEWPDEAETTTEPDYQPSLSRSEDDEWEDEMDDDDREIEGHQHDSETPTRGTNPGLNLGGIQIEFADDGDEDIDVDGDDTIVIGESNDPRRKSTRDFFFLLSSTF